MDLTYTTTHAGENEAVEGFHKAISHSESFGKTVR